MHHAYCRLCAEDRSFDPPQKNPYRPFAVGEAHEHLPRPRSFDVRHVKLELTLDDVRGRIAGRVTHSLHPIHEIRLVQLDSVDLAVHRVTLGGKRDLEFVVTPTSLVITLDRAYGSDHVLDLAIDYEGAPRKGLFFIRPDRHYPKKPLQVWSQGESEDNRFWFPSWDLPNDKSTSEAVLTVRDRFTAISNGRLVACSRDRKKKTRTFHWRQDVPHSNYLISLAVGEFVEVTDRCDGVPIQYYVRKGEADLARPTFGKTPDILRFFSEKIGYPYPYAKYSQIVLSDFMWGGMENTTMTTINERALVSAKVLDDVDADGLVAHELAHQWWGDLLTTKSWEHLWLNEGFATYFDALYTEHRKGTEEFLMQLVEYADAYFAEDRGSYRRPIVTRKYQDPEDLFDRHAYQKAALVLHMLRGVLGEELWWKSLNHYAHKHAKGVVETADLKIAIEEASGQALDGFFAQWLYGAGHPEYHLSWKWDAHTGLISVTVKQTQTVAGETPLFAMPATLRVCAADGHEDQRVRIEQAEHVFWFPVKGKPESVQLDPDLQLLRRIRTDKPRRELIFDLRRSVGVGARIQAARWLGQQQDHPEVVAALGEALRADGFHGVRMEAAHALGEVRSDGAFAELEKGLHDRHPKVRRAVARALGRFRTPEATKALIAVIGRDRSDHVAAEAVRALAHTRRPEAFAALARAAQRTSFHDVVAGAAFAGLAELKDPRGIPLAQAATAYGRPYAVRTAAIACLGRLWEHADKRADDVREHLTDLLDDRDHAARRATAAALAHVTDDAALAALQRHAECETIGLLRKVARDSIRRIREQRGEKGTLGRLATELDQVKDENRSLKNRLAALEARMEAAGKKGKRGK